MSKKIIRVNQVMKDAKFNFWVGKYMDKMYDAFENQKVIGNKCFKCFDVFFPPRNFCGKCKVVIPFDENWIDLPDTGILKNYTITPLKINEQGTIKVKEPQIIGMIQIDGSNTCNLFKILKIESRKVKIGMKVKIEWNTKTSGNPSDIKGFVEI